MRKKKISLEVSAENLTIEIYHGNQGDESAITEETINSIPRVLSGVGRVHLAGDDVMRYPKLVTRAIEVCGDLGMNELHFHTSGSVDPQRYPIIAEKCRIHSMKEKLRKQEGEGWPSVLVDPSTLSDEQRQFIEKWGEIDNAFVLRDDGSAVSDMVNALAQTSFENRIWPKMSQCGMKEALSMWSSRGMRIHHNRRQGCLTAVLCKIVLCADGNAYYSNELWRGVDENPSKMFDGSEVPGFTRIENIGDLGLILAEEIAESNYFDSEIITIAQRGASLWITY